jgi:hypothetical protein
MTVPSAEVEVCVVVSVLTPVAEFVLVVVVVWVVELLSLVVVVLLLLLPVVEVVLEPVLESVLLPDEPLEYGVRVPVIVVWLLSAVYCHVYAVSSRTTVALGSSWPFTSIQTSLPPAGDRVPSFNAALARV